MLRHSFYGFFRRRSTAVVGFLGLGSSVFVLETILRRIRLGKLFRRCVDCSAEGIHGISGWWDSLLVHGCEDGLCSTPSAHPPGARGTCRC